MLLALQEDNGRGILDPSFKGILTYSECIYKQCATHTYSLTTSFSQESIVTMHF
jgi:hypothetical protein